MGVKLSETRILLNFVEFVEFGAFDTQESKIRKKVFWRRASKAPKGPGAKLTLAV